MFKKMFSASLPVPPDSSVPSPSSSSLKPTTIPHKTAPNDDNQQVSSWTEIHPSKQEVKENDITEDGKDDVPELITPPCPPSIIEVRSSGTNDETSFLTKHCSGHIRDNSLETTVSQSMDLSSFIKSLELQQKEEPKQQQIGPDDEETPERSFRVGDSPHSGSLSLAASQVDISFASDTDDIQADSDTYETDNEICPNNSSDKTENIQIASNSNMKGNDVSSTSTSTKTTSGKPEIDNNTKPLFLKESNEVSMVDRSSSSSPSHSPSTKNNSYDLYTMANVGEHLFRESLVVGNGEKDKKEEQTDDATNNSDETLLKGNSSNKVVTKMAKVLVIVAIVFTFSGYGNTRPNDVTKTTALLTRYKLTGEEWQPSSKSNPQVLDTTSRSKLLDREQFPIENENNNDKIDKIELIPSNSSNYIHEECEDLDDNELPNSSKIVGYESDDWMGSQKIDHEQVPIEKTNYDAEIKPILDDSSNYAREEHKGHDDNELLNASEIGGVSNRSISLDSLTWPMVLLLITSCLCLSLQSASVSLFSSFKKKFKVGAKIEPVTPVTPSTKTSRNRKEHFLTPPPCKNRADGPVEFMSPIYSLDVSAYKAMKAVELRELLRYHKCDTRGTKEQMIKVLVQFYQNYYSNLTVKQLRPKLKNRGLSREGTKKDMVRRLTEAGPI